MADALYTFKRLRGPRTSPGNRGGAIGCGGERLHPVSIRLASLASQPTLARDLAHILDPTRVQQIGEMDHEGVVLPSNLNKRRMIVLKDFRWRIQESYL